MLLEKAIQTNTHSVIADSIVIFLALSTPYSYFLILPADFAYIYIHIYQKTISSF